MNLVLLITYLIMLILLQIRYGEFKLLSTFCASQQKVCRQQKHIACVPLKEKNPNIRLMMEVQLNSTSKLKIVQHFNKLKDSYAQGYNVHKGRSSPISNMRGLSWNDELAIIALKSFLNGYGDNNQSFCYTYVTNVTRQKYNLFEISSSMPFINKINDETFPKLLNKLTQRFNVNVLNDVTTNLFGCAGGVYVENNQQIKIKLKCMFNRLSTKSVRIKIGTACDDCEDWDVFCNQHYSGLCGETKIPSKSFDVHYMSDTIALPQSNNDSLNSFIKRTTDYIEDVNEKLTYYLIAYGLFLAIISSLLACVWKCRENPVFCLCKTAICSATKKLSKSEE